MRAEKSSKYSSRKVSAIKNDVIGDSSSKWSCISESGLSTVDLARYLFTGLSLRER